MEEKKKKVIFPVVALIFVAILVIALGTYAYWQITRKQTNRNVVGTACLDITFGNESNDILLENAWPTSDSDGANLTPYTFTITNTCDTPVNYTVALESVADQSANNAYLDYNYIRVKLDSEGVKTYGALGELTNDTNQEYTIRSTRELNHHTLAANDSVTHNLRLWIKEDTPLQNSDESLNTNKFFFGKIKIIAGQNIEGDTTVAGLSDFEKYILGSDGSGRPLYEIFDFENMKLIDDLSTPDVNESQVTSIPNPDYLESGLVYLTYNNDGNIYRIDLEGDMSNPEGLRTVPSDGPNKVKIINTSNENVGREVTIDGIEYIVLYDEGEVTSGAQLITKYAIKNPTEVVNKFGKEDPTLNGKNFTPFAENKTKNDQEPFLDLEKAIYSYNNAPRIINERCASLISSNNIIASVRSVGSNPISNSSSEVITPSNPYTNSELVSEPSSDSHYNPGVLVGRVSDSDSNFIEDVDRLVFLNKLEGKVKNQDSSESSTSYWMASLSNEGIGDFSIWSVNSDGVPSTLYIFGVYDDKFYLSPDSDGGQAYAFRPVVTLTPGSLSSLLN